MNNDRRGPVLGLLFYLIIMLIISYLFFMSAFSKTVGAMTKTINSDLGFMEIEDTLRCVNYQPLFDKDGNKQYEVYFRSYTYNTTFTCIVDKNEVEGLQNIQKDAKYECVLKVAYLKEYFEKSIVGFNGYTSEKQKEILLSSFKNKNFVDFYCIYDIDFMYSDNLSLLSFEENIDNMISKASQIVQINKTPIVKSEEQVED